MGVGVDIQRVSDRMYSNRAVLAKGVCKMKCENEALFAGRDARWRSGSWQLDSWGGAGALPVMQPLQGWLTEGIGYLG